MSRSASGREASRLKLLVQLDHQKSPSQRNRWGQFATPGPLADQIVRASLDLLPKRGKIRYLEPGFGTGPFFSALRQSTSRIEFAKGIELDPLFARNARKLWSGTGLSVVLGDFTERSPPSAESSKFNLVISNPPYVRHHHIDRSAKQALQRRVAERMNLQTSGLAGLYTHFMLLSQQWMTSGGIGAWLIPAEFMDVNYGDAVRKFLLERVTLLRIHRFSPNDVQFDDALVSSVVVFFKNEPPVSKQWPRQAEGVQWSEGGMVQRPKTIKQLEPAQLQSSSKWSNVASGRKNNPNGQALSDLFSIRRGIATGCNRFFVLHPKQISELKLPKQFLQPILPSPRYLETDVIAARSDGTPDIPNRKFLVRCSLSRSQIRRQSTSLDKYLQIGEDNGVDQGYLCRNRTPWFHQEHREPPLFLCTYMGRQTGNRPTPFRFIWNQSNAIAANVYLMLYPKPEFASRIGNQPDLQAQVFHRLKSITAETLIGEGRVYGGGLHKVEPKELAKVRIEL